MTCLTTVFVAVFVSIVATAEATNVANNDWAVLKTLFAAAGDGFLFRYVSIYLSEKKNNDDVSLLRVRFFSKELNQHFTKKTHVFH